MNILSYLGSYSLEGILSIASLWHPKVQKMLQGRKETISRVKEKLSPQKPTLWMHVSSLGEFEQGRPLIEKIRQEYPNYQILLSFYSPSGYEVRHNYTEVDCVVYFPGDTPKAIKRFLDEVRPEIAIFVKYDFWPVTLELLERRRIPTYVVSAIFREKQVFFRWYGTWYRKLLHRFTHLFVQDESSVHLLSNYGINNVSIVGDTRFDRVEAIASSSTRILEVEAFKEDQSPLLIVGSSWPDDERPILRYLEDNPRLKVVLAPHELEEERLQEIEQRFGQAFARLSDLRSGVKKLAGVRLLVIDCFGLLSSLYRYADIVYIGGGFGKGIHNTVEAAVYGVPIVFGPKYDKFREAKLLLDAGGAYSVTNESELIAVFDKLLSDDALRQESGRASRAVVESQLGATDKIINKLNLKS